MRRPKYIISWFIIGFTVPLLGTLTVNQFNWLQELQKREQERITRGMIDSSEKFSLKLQEEILYPAMITRIRPTDLAEIDTMFAERFRFWKNYAQNSALIKNVYLVDTFSGKTNLWDGAHFVHTEKSVGLDEWNELQRKGLLPDRFAETDTDLRIAEPAFSFMNRPYFLLYDLDKQIILDSLIPTIAKTTLAPTDLYAYRIIDTRNNKVLYTSLSRYRGSLFTDPDLELPIFQDNKQDMVLQSTGPFARNPPKQGPMMNDIRGAFGGEKADMRRPDPPDRQQRQRDPIIQSLPRLQTMQRGLSSNFLSSIRIQVVNRDGSLAAISARATYQNALISFGILAILLFGMLMLAEVSRRARELAKSQQEFIATITHELKTPLAVISSAAQNLGDGLVRDQAKAQQYGLMIKKEASRLGISIEHFLLYSNTNTITRMKPVSCDISDLVQSALKFTEEEREKYEFRTEVVIPEEPVYIRGDRIALESVFQNLAQNVIRHAKTGKYLGVFVSLEEKQKGKRTVIIKVRDKGPGIPAKEQKTIFEPFVRGKRAINEQIPGNGIGLNLVKRIVTVHEGTIALESKVDNGSTFILTFPESRGDMDAYQDSDDRG